MGRSLRVKGIWVVLALFVWVSPQMSFASYACYDLFTLPDSGEIPAKLKIMTFNLENLEVIESNGQSFREQTPELQKEILRNIKIKNVLSEIDADIMVLTEVKGPEALKNMISRLPSKYSRFIVEGNDTIGSQIAIVIKKDIPLEAVYETHRNMKWRDPVWNEVKPVFTRDAPALLLRRPGQKIPFLIVMGVHAKSQRDREGDPRSEILRTAEFEGYVSIIHGYQRLYGDKVPILLAGDFNTDVITSPEIKLLKVVLSSGFDLANISTPESQRTTHTYHPGEKPAVHHQIDDILMPEFLRDNVFEMHVHRYKDVFGNILPFAQSFIERSEQASDHLPLVLELSTSGL